MNRQQRIELLQLLDEKKRRERVNRYKRLHKTLYPWQREFLTKTGQYREVCLIAANRIGKTYTGTYIDAIHALGDYPEGWEGHRFEAAPLIWVLGYSGEKIRDLLQLPIVGSVSDGKCDGGLIPVDRIVDVIPASGTPRLAKEVKVKHASGGISRIQFWSYSQGQHALMGDSVDWFHIDEEPRDATIYPQVLTRTATGDRGRGGRGILTFTPENGRTDLVIQFMDSPGSAQVAMNAGWDDAPHLTEDVKSALLESFPAHQREMRTKGIPMLGHGRIYDFGEDYITCEPFEIPNHWHVINGMDFGWDHPQAHVQLAIDRDNGMFYVTHAWAQSRQLPEVAWGAVKGWAQNVPTAWPADGLQTEKGSGLEQKAHYQRAGFKMLGDHAQWPDGSRSVEAGLFEIRALMSKGQFKVFRGLRGWFDEFLQFHRDEKGNIVKIRDDILDATRYAYMMQRFAVAKGELGVKKTVDLKPPRKSLALGRTSGGYWM
jgi:phage terminase large subunit-like protein